jgi:1-acyl-sn-glycerol-3-phosphate acyltransferase
MLQLETKPTILTSDFSQTYRIVPSVFFPLYWLGKTLVLPFYFNKIEFTGQENIPTTGPVILAPTHRSRWDGLMMTYAAGFPTTKRNLRFMVTKNEMKGIQGAILKRVGCFPVEIGKPSLSTFRHSIEVLCNHEILVIFPEGGIFEDTIVHPVKPGISRIALQAQSMLAQDVKIVPVSLHYDPIPPSRGANVYIDFGRPLNVANYLQGSSRTNSQSLTADLERKITSLYNCRVNKCL